MAPMGKEPRDATGSLGRAGEIGEGIQKEEENRKAAKGDRVMEMYR